jgi:hypothetical protein
MRLHTALAAALCALVSGGAAQALAANGTPAPPAVQPARTCPSIKAEHDFWEVTVVRGSIGCAAAREVLASFIGGAGVEHGGPYEYEKHWDLGRWRCAHGAGSASCIRGSASYKTAKDYISAAIKTSECGHPPVGASEPPECEKAEGLLPKRRGG